MLIVFSLSVCLSVSLSISLYVYSVYDFYNNNNNNTGFRLVGLPISMALNDFKRRNSPYFANSTANL